MAKGIYREDGGWANDDAVGVIYENGATIEMSRADYQKRGYQPHYDSLPTKAEYLAANPPFSDGAS